MIDKILTNNLLGHKTFMKDIYIIQLTYNDLFWFGFLDISEENDVEIITYLVSDLPSPSKGTVTKDVWKDELIPPSLSWMGKDT